MSAVTQDHEQKETLVVDVIVPGHEPRATTPLFEHTRKLLIAREGARCFVCGRDERGSGHPLEAHHHPIEWSLAPMIDWSVGAPIRLAFPSFDWTAFDADTSPERIYRFVDDMTVNGLLLCKDHHTGSDQGIHALPHPLWVAQRFGREGYRFSNVETIHHAGQQPEKGLP